MCIFTTPLETSQRLGELLVQGRVPAGAVLQYLKGKALRWWCCGTRQGTGTGALRPPSATGLKHVAAPGPVCSRLCVPGKIHVYRTSCPGAKQCSAPAGRTPAEGSSPSIPPPERVSQRGFVVGSVFVARLLFWKQRCSCVPWPFCPSAKGPAVKEDCPDHPPQAGFPQACPPVISHCQYKPEMTNNFQRVKKGTFLAARTAVAGDHHPVKNSN